MSIVDNLGLVFYPGEPFTQIGLSLAARSSLKDTLLLSNSNGRHVYVGTDEDLSVEVMRCTRSDVITISIRRVVHFLTLWAQPNP